MKYLYLLTLPWLLACAVDSSKTVQAPQVLPTTIKDAVNSEYRTAEFQKRDIYRHPAQTLEFFGLTPTMTVVEIWPSGGWYTEILAPFLTAQGKYIIADPAADPNGYTKPRVAWLERFPHIASKVEKTTFAPPASLEIAAPGSADMVLTFRNVHNWAGDEGKQAAFNAFFKALKPGGTLGVVEHRANPKKKFDPKSGYMLEKDVIRFAEKAGFRLVDRSEINANPADTTVWPEGVWTLPPRLRLGEKDKQKYLAVGESDRMTLKFEKPIK